MEGIEPVTIEAVEPATKRVGGERCRANQAGEMRSEPTAVDYERAVREATGRCRMMIAEPVGDGDTEASRWSEIVERGDDEGPITFYTVQRSNAEDRMAQAPQRDDPALHSHRDHTGRSSRRPSASTSAPSSSTPLCLHLTLMLCYLQSSRMPLRHSRLHSPIRSLDSSFGATPFGTSQFGTTQFGTSQFGTSQFGASQFSGGRFSQFGVGSSFVPPVAPVAPPPVFPPRIIEDYDEDDDA
ncbi:hypothetical protein Dimus_003523 [Dionaea muscipula]